MKIGLRGGHSPNCKGALGKYRRQMLVSLLLSRIQSQHVMVIPF